METTLSSPKEYKANKSLYLPLHLKAGAKRRLIVTKNALNEYMSTIWFDSSIQEVLPNKIFVVIFQDFCSDHSKMPRQMNRFLSVESEPMSEGEASASGSTSACDSHPTSSDEFDF